MTSRCEVLQQAINQLFVSPSSMQATMMRSLYVGAVGKNSFLGPGAWSPWSLQLEMQDQQCPLPGDK